jgi:hypothetical protein
MALYFWPIYLVVTLPVNVLATWLARGFLLRQTPAMGRLLSSALFGIMWFLAIQILPPIVELNHGLLVDAFTIAAAVAGAAYGLGLTMPVGRRVRGGLP